jgi:hypothetical protein
MITIHIQESKRSASAIKWCLKHLPKSIWTVETDWPAQNYRFIFNDDEHATLFRLKWA